MIKAVIFDLDGTLIDSLDDLSSAVNCALSVLGYDGHAREKYKYFVGDGMQKLIERALPEDDRSPENHSKCLNLFTGYYAEHYAVKSRAYNGIAEMLAELKNKGIILCVLSNKAHDMTISVVNRFFDGIFDMVYGKRDGIPAKPDVKAVELLLSELNLAPDECLFVGDSGNDMSVAVKSGILPVGVLWGFREREELLTYGAWKLISAPEELPEIIVNISNGLCARG